MERKNRIGEADRAACTGGGEAPVRPQETVRSPQPESAGLRHSAMGADPAAGKVVVVATEPADYTVDLIRNVYQPKGVDWCFLKGSSLASEGGADLAAKPVVGDLPIFQMVAVAFRLLKRNDVLILHGWTQRFNVLVALLNLAFFRKPMAWESDTPLRIPKNCLKRLAKGLWLRTLFRRRFCWGFAGGNYAHKDLFRHYGMPEGRIVLAPMVVDSARIAAFRPSAAPAQKPFRFAYLGRLIARKRVDLVIRAFRGLPPGAELHIVGEGPEKVRLQSLADGDPRIVFHGAVFGDEKFRLLATMSCLVLFSRDEPWGLVVNEALSMGIPCIVSGEVGARHDLIAGAESGIVVPSGDEAALRAAMARLAGDAELYARQSRKAAERMKTWTYREYAQNFDAFLAAVREGRTSLKEGDK